MKISLIQMNSEQDRDTNVKRACDFIDKAAKAKPDLIVLPEFFNTIYFAQYRDLSYVKWAERDDGYSMTRIRDKAKQHGIHIIATIFEEEAPGFYFDTAIVVDPQGGIAGKYRKTHPAGFRSIEKIYYRYGTKYPVFKIKDWRVGMVICYDMFFPESACSVALNGAELIVVPFCEPRVFTTPQSTNLPAMSGAKSTPQDEWLSLWQARMRVRALENTAYVAPCNHAGKEDQVEYGGGTMVVDPRGAIVTEAGAGEGIISAELDRELFNQARQMTPFLRDRRPDLYGAVCAQTEDLFPFKE